MRSRISLGTITATSSTSISKLPPEHATAADDQLVGTINTRLKKDVGDEPNELVLAFDPEALAVAEPVIPIEGRTRELGLDPHHELSSTSIPIAAPFQPNQTWRRGRRRSNRTRFVESS